MHCLSPSRRRCGALLSRNCMLAQDAAQFCSRRSLAQMTRHFHAKASDVYKRLYIHLRPLPTSPRGNATHAYSLPICAGDIRHSIPNTLRGFSCCLSSTQALWVMESAAAPRSDGSPKVTTGYNNIHHLCLSSLSRPGTIPTAVALSMRPST